MALDTCQLSHSYSTSHGTLPAALHQKPTRRLAISGLSQAQVQSQSLSRQTRGDTPLLLRRPESRQPHARTALRCVSLLPIPRPLTYSTRLADADPDQIAQLWSVTLGCDRDPAKVQKALSNSFSLVVVIDEAIPSSTGSLGQVVGVGRAVSDGAFVATICDISVHPDYQKRGIGRRIVKELVKDMRRRGPSGFAVFPPPFARRFFWHLGFRPDTKYRLMAYQGRLKGASPGDMDSYGLALNRNMGALLAKIARNRAQSSLLRHMDSLECDGEETEGRTGEVEGRTEEVDPSEAEDVSEGTNMCAAMHDVPHLGMTLHEERETVLR